MFGLWRHKKPDIYTHWYVVFPNFSSDIEVFYQLVEGRILRAKLPGLEFSRMRFSEAGLLTAGRDYLRARRERLVFEICSAPLGSAWYFSCRCGEIPFRFRLWEALLLTLLVTAIYFYYAFVFGAIWGGIMLGLSVVSFLTLLNALAASPRRDLDTLLLRVPILGSLYELFLRRNLTYVREDSRLAYIHLVDSFVRQIVEEIAHDQGIEEFDFLINPDPISPLTFIDRVKDRIKALLTATSGRAAIIGKDVREF